MARSPWFRLVMLSLLAAGAAQAGTAEDEMRRSATT